eukprot:1152522-Pelagomonas_calceolata.AAC.3
MKPRFFKKLQGSTGEQRKDKLWLPKRVQEVGQPGLASLIGRLGMLLMLLLLSRCSFSACNCLYPLLCA